MKISRGNQKILLMAFGLYLLFSVPAYADMVWPALYLEQRMVSWWAIAVGLIIEYLFVRKLTGFGMIKSIWANLIMNFASTLLGLTLIPITGVIWELIAEKSGLYSLLRVHTFNPVTWAVTLLIAVLINTVIETFVLVKIFKSKIGWQGFWWLALANSMSVGLAFLSLWFIPPWPHHSKPAIRLPSHIGHMSHGR